MSKDVVSGVGVRYAEAFILDPVTGLPAVGFNAGTLTAGTLIQGIKEFLYNSPASQKVEHYGDDNAFAQDSLPPTSVGDFTITTAKTNLTLDAFTEGTKVVTLDGVVEARAGNTDQRGSEPHEFISVYRQALDTQKGSPTFGKLREWHCALIPSTRLVNNLQPMQQTSTVKTYQGIPTPVTYTPWNSAFDQTTWGAQQAEYIEITTTYKPVWNMGLGNGTLTQFALSKPPVDAAHCHVWANGTLATVSSVGTSPSNPYVIVSSPPGPNLIAVLIEHNQSS